jgi:hypothetical protein
MGGSDELIGRDKSSDYENLSSPLLNIHSSWIRAVGIDDAMAVRARSLFSYVRRVQEQGASKNQTLALRRSKKVCQTGSGVFFYDKFSRNVAVFIGECELL